MRVSALPQTTLAGIFFVHVFIVLRSWFITRFWHFAFPSVMLLMGTSLDDVRPNPQSEQSVIQ